MQKTHVNVCIITISGKETNIECLLWYKWVKFKILNSDEYIQYNAQKIKWKWCTYGKITKVTFFNATFFYGVDERRKNAEVMQFIPVRIIAVLGSMSLSRRPFVWPEMLHNMNKILLSFLPFTSLHWINSNIWLTTAVGPPCLNLKQSVNHFFVEGYRNWQELKGRVGMNETETIACLTPSWSWFLVGGYPYKDLSVSLELKILHTFYICWNLGNFDVVYSDFLHSIKHSHSLLFWKKCVSPSLCFLLEK